MPHTGGTRFTKDSELYQTLLKWIDAGVPNDGKEIPALIGLEIYPQHSVLNGPGEKQQLTVRATYSDGHDRDVTRLAYFLSSNDTSATVSPEGIVTAGAAWRGARYGAVRPDHGRHALHRAAEGFGIHVP